MVLILRDSIIGFAAKSMKVYATVMQRNMHNRKKPPIVGSEWPRPK
jgi:hypothetical protein